MSKDEKRIARAARANQIELRMRETAANKSRAKRQAPVASGSELNAAAVASPAAGVTAAPPKRQTARGTALLAVFATLIVIVIVIAVVNGARSPSTARSTTPPGPGVYTTVDPSLSVACAARWQHVAGSGKVGFLDPFHYDECIKGNGSNLNQ